MKKRIIELAKLIKPYTKVADVGCDHGYLILEALNNGVTFAQAIDNKQGPLNQAISNLDDFKDRVEFSLSNGLESLNKEVEVIVISGMGGKLIIEILNKDFNKLSNIKKIIIQANKNISDVRKYMMNNGFKVSCEKIIFEDANYYELIVFESGQALYSPLELLYGPMLIKERSEIFLNKYNDLIKKYEQIDSLEITKKINKIKKDLNI